MYTYYIMIEQHTRNVGDGLSLETNEQAQQRLDALKQAEQLSLE